MEGKKKKLKILSTKGKGGPAPPCETREHEGAGQRGMRRPEGGAASSLEGKDLTGRAPPKRAPRNPTLTHREGREPLPKSGAASRGASASAKPWATHAGQGQPSPQPVWIPTGLRVRRDSSNPRGSAAPPASVARPSPEGASGACTRKGRAPHIQRAVIGLSSFSRASLLVPGSRRCAQAREPGLVSLSFSLSSREGLLQVSVPRSRRYRIWATAGGLHDPPASPGWTRAGRRLGFRPAPGTRPCALTVASRRRRGACRKAEPVPQVLAGPSSVRVYGSEHFS